MATPWPQDTDRHVREDHRYTRAVDYDLWHYLAHLAGDADHEHSRDEG